MNKEYVDYGWNDPVTYRPPSRKTTNRPWPKTTARPSTTARSSSARPFTTARPTIVRPSTTARSSSTRPSTTARPITVRPTSRTTSKYWNWLTSKPRKTTTRRPYDDDYWWITQHPRTTTKKYYWMDRTERPTTRWDWLYTQRPKTTINWDLSDFTVKPIKIPTFNYDNYDTYTSSPYDYNYNSGSSSHGTGTGVGLAVGGSVFLFIFFIIAVMIRVATCKRRLERMRGPTLPRTISATVVQPSRVRGPQLGNTRTLIRAPSTVTRQQNRTGSQPNETGNGRLMIIRIRRVFCFRQRNPYSTLPEPRSPPPYTPENEAPPSYETTEGATSDGGTGVNTGETRAGDAEQNRNDPPPEYTERY